MRQRSYTLDLSGNGHHYPTARRVTQPGPLQKTPIYKGVFAYLARAETFAHNSVHTANTAVPRTPVLVVGAGPAGATAARTLAAAGFPVCLLDRSSFPRNKPCGGGISTRVLTRFPYLQPGLRRITTHTVARLRLEGPDGHSTVIESDAPAALMIRRVEYDALLVSLAVEAGATLVPGVDVVQARQHAEGVELVARDGRRFEGAVVVAADGVNSVIARRLGLNPGWPASSVAIDMMEETPRAEVSRLKSQG